MSDAMTEQYEAAPVPGMRRFWMSVETWVENWPEAPFCFWQTGSGCEYRLRPTVMGTPEAAGLPEKTDLFGGNISDLEVLDDLDEFYISSAMVCMLVDAADENAAWEVVQQCFPVMVRRFCSPADEMTLASLARGGRFTHPGNKAIPVERTLSTR